MFVSRLGLTLRRFLSWCTRNPVHATADTSSATLELALERSKRAGTKAPCACVVPGCSLPYLAGARATRQPLSEQRGAVGGARIVRSAVVLCARGRARCTHNIKKTPRLRLSSFPPYQSMQQRNLHYFLRKNVTRARRAKT